MKEFATELEREIWETVHEFNATLRNPMPDGSCRLLMDEIHDICENHMNREARRLLFKLREGFINDKMSLEK
jgi:hypothetical protein